MANVNVKAVITAEDKASATLRHFGDSADRAGSQTSASMRVAAAAFATATSAAVFFGAKTAGELESSTQGFKTLLGSAKEADAIMGRIKSEAARTPFEITGLTEATQLLAAVTKDGDRALQFIMNIGEGLAAMGRGQAELDRIAVNLQQIAATGRAFGIDIKQFAFAGIPIYEMLQDQIGLTGEELTKFIEEGGVTFELLEKMFEDATDAGGRWSGAFENQAGTFNQLLSNMKDSFSIFMSDLLQGTGAFDAMKGAMAGVTNLMQDRLFMAFIKATAVFGAVIGSVYALATAVRVLRVAFDLLSRNPIVATLTILGTAIVPVLTAIIYRLTGNVEDAADSFTEAGNAAKEDLGGGATQASDDLKRLQERLADIDTQMGRTTRDFRESLAEMVKGHQDKVKQLRGQIGDERGDFKKAEADKKREFEQTQADLSEAHEKRVKDIQKQLDHELRLGRHANFAKVADLKDELAEEEAEYRKQFERNKSRYSADRNEAKENHNEKLRDLQSALNEELAFLRKHSEDVKSIREQDFLDEIEKLKRNHQERMAELAKQRKEVVNEMSKISTAMQREVNKALDTIKVGTKIAVDKVTGLRNRIAELGPAANLQIQPLKNLNKTAAGILQGGALKIQGNKGTTAILNFGTTNLQGATGTAPVIRPGGNARGTTFSNEGWSWVGEEGPELMKLPRGSQVRSNQDSLNAPVSQPVNINVHVGMFAGSEMEIRKVAMKILEAARDAAGMKNMTVQEILR